MKPINGFDSVQPFADAEKLPPGGYIIGILEADERSYEDGNNYIEIKFDIAEGEYKNFYTNQYKSSQIENKKYKGSHRVNVPREDGTDADAITARILKTMITSVEISNPGYRWAWDEKTLKSKKVGAVFFEKEYEINGKRGFFTALHSFRGADAIKDGKFNVPPPKMLKKASADFPGTSETIDDEELPF